MPSTDDLIAALEAPGPLREQPAVQLLLSEKHAAPPLFRLIEGAAGEQISSSPKPLYGMEHLRQVVGDLERRAGTTHRTSLRVVQGGDDAA